MRRRTVLAGIGTAAGAGLAGCTGRDMPAFTPGTETDADWPLPRYDPGNAAYSPDAAAPRTGVQQRWTLEAATAAGPPAVVDGTVYQPLAAGLVALDAADGTEQWRFPPDDQPWPAPPVVHDGIVIVGMQSGDGLYGLDAATGEPVWEHPDLDVTGRPHLIAGQLVDEPVVYVGTEQGVVRRIEPATGAVTWRTDLFGAITAFGFRAASLYVGTAGGEVYAYRNPAETESPGELWRRKVGSRIREVVPTAQGLLVDTFGGPLQNLGTGAHAGVTQWRIDAARASRAPVHANGSVVTTGVDAIAAHPDFSPTVRWRVGGRYDATAPVAAGDTLYVSSGDAVHAFPLDGGGLGGVLGGRKRWSYPTPGAAVEGLAVGAGALFVAAEGRSDAQDVLYRLDPA